jgi:hypothetical protein
MELWHYCRIGADDAVQPSALGLAIRSLDISKGNSETIFVKVPVLGNVKVPAPTVFGIENF